MHVHNLPCDLCQEMNINLKRPYQTQTICKPYLAYAKTICTTPNVPNKPIISSVEKKKRDTGTKIVGSDQTSKKQMKHVEVRAKV